MEAELKKFNTAIHIGSLLYVVFSATFNNISVISYILGELYYYLCENVDI
jgi:hypothetical protein